jgi:hypothetical protein
MFREIFDDKNQKRRKNSMLKNSFGKLKYLFVLAFLLVTPIKSWGGAPFALSVNTDTADMQLFSFWDLRDRESFVQVTNTGSAPVTVHVQIFNAGDGCDEVDFYDDYTPQDTHVYNLRALTRNNGDPLNIVLPSDGFGLVAVTVVAGVGGPAIFEPVLIGSFRVIDDSGYEYRTNSAGIDEGFFGFSFYTINFNNLNGANASDVVGVLVTQVGPGFIEVVAQGTGVTFDANIFDADENVISCGNFTFRCNSSQFDVGINDAYPATKGGPEICNGNTDTVGFLSLDTFGIFPGIFVGFVGLNNGDGTGSMDSWWQTSLPVGLID